MGVTLPDQEQAGPRFADAAPALAPSRERFRRFAELLASAPVRHLLVALLYLLVLAAPWAAWQTVDWSEGRAYERLAAQGRDRLTLYGVTLRSEMEKYGNIPVVLSSDPDVIALLAAPNGPPRDERAEKLDRRLQAINETLGASAIYVLDGQGTTLAASNWAQGAGSFVGQRFDFRPYFLAAMAGRPGRYFALGSTSNIPGYYIALPVRRGEHVIGAVVVKMSMDELERGWSGGGERVFVSDRFGVIFITNTPSWRFRSLTPLDAETQRELQASRQYGDTAPRPLGLVSGDKLTTVDRQGYVMVSQPLSDSDGWTLHVLMEVKDSQARARDQGFLAVAGISLTIIGVYFLIHRGRLQRRHTRELEGRVAERTAALVDSNVRLHAEVVERRRAEEELRAKQDELVQATKLAALGQMSAGMAHEINQPLAAIRSYADNARTLLDLGKAAVARENMTEIAGLTERMARITGQLKQFARKSSPVAEPISVTGVVEGVLALMASRLQAEAVDVHWQPPAEDLLVWGEEVRLQQVLVNLLRNALDAMRDVAEPRLWIIAEPSDRIVKLVVRDDGPGIAAEAMAHLFDPFFTTKPAGEGLGLGLSISEGIVQDLGGHLAAANTAGGGAQFTITLRRADIP